MLKRLIKKIYESPLAAYLVYLAAVIFCGVYGVCALVNWISEVVL